MPFILRIILQRVLLFIYSILAFLGIAPEVHIPTEQESLVNEEYRKEIIRAAVTEKPVDSTINDLEKLNEENQGPVENVEKVDSTKPADPVPEPITPPVTTTPTVVIPKPIVQIPPPIPVAPIIPPTEPIQSVKPPVEEIKQKTIGIDDVLVNTVCVERTGNAISVSTGSGVIVSPSGIVLTNAHVAQFFLIQDYDNSVDCAIYKENIPTYGYEAEILYISENWIKENYESFREKTARGTGEDDYAILRIIKNTNPSLSLPAEFPFANVVISDSVEIGDEVVAAGYPGGPISLFELTKSRKLVTAVLSVLDVFTFGGNNPDIFTVTRSEVGAKGSSGGGVFKENTENSLDLIGIIVTTDGTNGNAKINAITTSYINRDISKETGNKLSYYLSGNLSSKSTSFKNNNLNDLASLLTNQGK